MSGVTMIKFIITASVSSFFFGLFGINWDAIDSKIDLEFPDIAFVSADQLSRQYIIRNSDMPVIIDVRAAEEFQVSHLPDALNIETGELISQLITDKNSPIVVYCSVGYRSAGVAAELERLGYTRVLNLRHSIFEWASKGHPMLNATGETEKVHPFNRIWGVLVDRSLHVYSLE